MAPISTPMARNVATWVTQQLGVDLVFVDDVPWQERDRRFDVGDVQVCWICGLPYVIKADAAEPQVELLAAPVPRGGRYAQRPVYYSDVVVRADGPIETFSELRGASWAFNEPLSHSGSSIVRNHLAKLGEPTGFFGSVIQSGSHEASLRLLVAGEVEGSAIDSTVLDLASRRDPSLRARLRVVEILGPSPIPPWVIRTDIDPGLRSDIRRIMLEMHHDQAGRQALDSGLVARFANVRDSDYDPVRRMARHAAHVTI